MTPKILFCVYVILTILRFASGSKVHRVGIVGGGIGGTSCAYFLQSLFGDVISIDVYEADKIGGRLAVVNFSKNSYEEGGSIIHSRNKYMVEFLEKFKFSKRQTPDGYFGLYDGKDFVFSESEWQVRTLWSVVRRYGLGFWKLRSYIDDMLKKFEKIYELQEKGMTFNTVGSMLAAMDPEFVGFLQMTTKAGFEKQGIPNIVVDEIIMATIRANYGQNLKIHKMVGSVSVAGAIGTLWSVHGGNVKIPQTLLKISKANLINRTVTSIKRLSPGQVELRTKDEPEDCRVYDVVVVATPQTSDSKHLIKFENFEEDINFQGKYHKTVCTLVKGVLSNKRFPTRSPFVDEILTTKGEVPFNSIGRITPVDYTSDKYKNSDVWKVFTQNKMNDTEISSLFSNVKDVHVREWLAYPHYGHSFRNDSFVLTENVYHINAIEWAASAMEMSIIGAKNVALLVYKNLVARGNSSEDPVPQHVTNRGSNLKEDL